MENLCDPAAGKRPPLEIFQRLLITAPETLQIASPGSRVQRGRRRGDGQKEDWTVTMQLRNLISEMSWDEIVLLDKEQNDGKLLIRSSRDFILHSEYPRTSPQSSGMGQILPEAPHQFSLTLINNQSLRHQIAEQPLTVSNSEMDVACQGWRGDSK
ncbi:hypothetical protein DPX16_20091 [Anabarilius grahami]|uniref:Uncharacterized protein n=1 Tax=Anabarilius grahami TaxID=495550 RepID=A0A3N0XQN6_ANAGA|nr:hypothetical protein DPX16_20091 [Anabarilius grahami]